MLSMLYAAADVDHVWLFIFAAIAFVLAVIVIIQTFRSLPLLAISAACISFAGMLAWWP